MVNLVFRVLGWGFRVLGRSIFKGLEFRVCCNFLNLEIADFWLEVTRSASNFTTDMCEQNPQIPTSRSPKIGVNATSWKIWSNWAENLDTSLIIAASYCFVSPSFIGHFIWESALGMTLKHPNSACTDLASFDFWLKDFFGNLECSSENLLPLCCWPTIYTYSGKSGLLYTFLLF